MLVALALGACGTEGADRLDGSARDAGPLDATRPGDGGPGDGGPSDGGPSDAGVVDQGPGFEHCPPPSAYVGDSSWPGSLTTQGALLCAFPRMGQTPADARARKRRLKLVEGAYPFPLSVTEAPFRLPACLERRGADLPPEILEGRVSAERRQEFDDPTERYHVTSELPLSGGRGRILFDLRAELDGTQLDLGAPVDDHARLQLTWCVTPGCFSEDDLRFLPCRLASNTCDRFDFTGGFALIDQFHWAGQVGSGFAAGVRVRGALDGTSFDIDAYEQILVTYGHHAFLRGLTLFFDAPIGAACGLFIEEIAEVSGSDVVLIDCAGAPIETRATTAQSHLWREPCPP